MWAETLAEQERCSISNVHCSVLAAKGEVAELKGAVAGLQETIEKMARDHASQMSDVVQMLGEMQERCAAPCFANTPTTGLELVVTPVRDGARADGGAPDGAAAGGGGGGARGGTTMMDQVIMISITKISPHLQDENPWSLG